MASGVLAAGIKAIAKTRRDEPFDEQLLALFRNRAALKKEHNELRNRYEGLKEKLRNAEAGTRRAEERLEAIERLMAKPEAGYNDLPDWPFHELADSLGGVGIRVRTRRELAIMPFAARGTIQIDGVSEAAEPGCGQQESAVTRLDGMPVELDVGLGQLQAFAAGYTMVDCIHMPEHGWHYILVQEYV